MSVAAVVLIVAVAALVVVWLVQAYKQPPPKRRISSDYRHQHTENPDYLPGHAGGASGG